MEGGAVFPEGTTTCFVIATSRLAPPTGAAYYALRAEMAFVGAPHGGVAGTTNPFSPPQNGWSAATATHVFTVWANYYPVRFGCSIQGGPELKGVNAYCTVSYLCF